ncbi:MAG TPA: hypothetical protein VMZ52_11375 [Bryobacteraceae bacterium]|nr:hypothetical protein [Bryobacteraceae bacterium]
MFSASTLSRITLLLASAVPALLAAELPGRYFALLDAGARKVDDRLRSEPSADLAQLETTAGWKHFGYSILAPAVLYTRQHAANPRYHDPALLALTIRIGDLLASEHEKGKFKPRLDSDWDTYTWLEAYRLIGRELDATRRERWKRALLENVASLENDAAERLDFPWYQSPYIGTSPNHYSQWAQLLYLAGQMFDNPKWKDLGGRILHRFAAVEQSADGFWGEHTRDGPTIGYNHLTLSAVAVYYEHSKDPAALQALRRSLTFHENFTYPDGIPVETMNDRNRYWGVSAWSQFAFSHFPDGRRYAEFLSKFFGPASLTMDQIGRLAQDALYYHEGPLAPIPQDGDRYVRQMSIPAGIRKTGPWTVSLSGLIETQAITNQFYLDRQANISVFHSRAGLIISGANSKRQPELATFREKLTTGEVLHLPASSRLQMTPTGDRVSLAFNSFFADLFVAPPSDSEIKLRFAISGKGRPPEEAFATLQLVLHPGETLQTAHRTITVSAEPVKLGPEEIGGWIQHHGWKLYVDPGARLTWPSYPFNPYQNAPEQTLDHAVAALSVPLQLRSRPGRYVRPNEQEIAFRLTAE